MDTVRLDLYDLMPSKLTRTSMLPVPVNITTPLNIVDDASGTIGINSWPNERNLGAETTGNPKSNKNSVRSKATKVFGDAVTEPR